MLRGDLATVPIEQVLLRLADGAATGCLHLTSSGTAAGTAPAASHGTLHLRDGLVRAATLGQPGSDRPGEDVLGERLVAAGLVSPDQLLDAERARATELTHWSLPELLVHLGHVEEDRVADVVRERALDAAGEMSTWTTGTWRFRRGERTRQLLPEPLSVEGLLALLRGRAAERDRLLADLGGPRSVPVRRAPTDITGTTDDGSAGAAEDDSARAQAREALGTDGSALLALVDGVRTLEQLSGSYGMTSLEVLRLVQAMRDQGLLHLVAGGEAEPDARQEQRWEPLDLQDLVHDGAVSATGLLPLDDAPVGTRPADGDDVARSLQLTTGALGSLIGQTPGAPRPATAEDERRERIRAAAAAELALAHAEAEAERGRQEAEGHVPSLRPGRSPVSAVDELLLARDALGLPRAADQPAAPVADASPVDDAPPAPWSVPSRPEAEAHLPEAAPPVSPLPPASPPPPSSPAPPVDVVPASSPAPSLSPAPPVAPAAPWTPEPPSAEENGLADTAALMRELSSLGLDQDTPAPRAAPAGTQAGQHRAMAAADAARPRRKGRFGR